MSELEKDGIYACSLAMPGFDFPLCKKWVCEIKLHTEQNIDDEIYLVGHSLGSTSILRYLEDVSINTVIAGSILVSTPIERTNNRDLDNFFETEPDYQKIKKNCRLFSVIHGDNDTFVPITQAEKLANVLNCSFISIPNGGHLSGHEMWHELPQCLDTLEYMIEQMSTPK